MRDSAPGMINGKSSTTPGRPRHTRKIHDSVEISRVVPYARLCRPQPAVRRLTECR
jgi:hypothetical protein